MKKIWHFIQKFLSVIHAIHEHVCIARKSRRLTRKKKVVTEELKISGKDNLK